MEHIHPLQDELISALIGLARAVSGNEDLITGQTDQLVLNSLAIAHPEANMDHQLLSQQIQRVADEKKRIVPDCAVCCNPCGRTDNYDMQNLWNAPEEIRCLKYQVLTDIQQMATYACKNELPASSLHDLAGFLCKVLFALGIDYWTADKWATYAQEIRQQKASV